MFVFVSKTINNNINILKEKSKAKCQFIPVSLLDINNKIMINVWKLCCILCRNDYSNFIKDNMRINKNLSLFLTNCTHKWSLWSLINIYNLKALILSSNYWCFWRKNNFMMHLFMVIKFHNHKRQTNLK